MTTTTDVTADLRAAVRRANERLKKRRDAQVALGWLLSAAILGGVIGFYWAVAG